MEYLRKIWSQEEKLKYQIEEDDLLQEQGAQDNMARIERSHQVFRQRVQDRKVLKDIRQCGTILGATRSSSHFS